MITFSNKAILFLKAQSDNSNLKYLHITIKKMGCSGFKYQIQWQENPSDFLTIIDGLNVCLDPSWQHILDITTVDLQEDAIGQKKITFSNKLENMTCGCGESFQLK